MLPGSSLKLVAPVTDHDNVEDCPLVIVAGEALNEAIAGRGGGGGAFVTVTMTLLVTLPALLIAANV
jgi:hypothetical protein